MPWPSIISYIHKAHIILRDLLLIDLARHSTKTDSRPIFKALKKLSMKYQIKAGEYIFLLILCHVMANGILVINHQLCLHLVYMVLVDVLHWYYDFIPIAGISILFM